MRHLKLFICLALSIIPALIALVIFYPQEREVYEITGICSVPKPVRDVIIPTSAFLEDALRLKCKIKPIPLMMDHGRSVKDIVGRVTELNLSVGRTFFKAEIIKTKETAAIIQQIKDRVLTDVSIGFMILERSGHPPYIAYRIDLIEISLVYAGADPDAIILGIRRIK